MGKNTRMGFLTMHSLALQGLGLHGTSAAPTASNGENCMSVASRGRGLLLTATLVGLCAGPGLAGPSLHRSATAPMALVSGPRLTAPQDQRDAAPERYVLAGASGATVRGLPDPKGHAVLQVDGDTPLEVYAFRAGNPFLKVAIPGGVKVWVFGKYLEQSSRPGWVEVSGNFVNMRPMPRSTDSYPLGRLSRGDRLRFIQRKDTSKPMSEDWVQVYSPQETKGYVLAAETRGLPAGSDAKMLWNSAVDRALSAQPKVTVPGSKAGGVPVKPLEAVAPAPAAGSLNRQTESERARMFTELKATNAVMDAAFADNTTPNYADLEARYTAIMAMGPDGPTSNLINQRMERLAAHKELTAIRAELEDSKSNHEKQVADMKANAERGKRGNEPMWGRFQTRGWVERQVRDGEVMYLVRWGSSFLAQIQCSSGRYELDLYDGFEIGVKGEPVRSAKVMPGSYPLIDVDRIEVISARLGKR